MGGRRAEIRAAVRSVYQDSPGRSFARLVRVVYPGPPRHRGNGISHALLDGAVAYARSGGAPAVEGYPVDNRGQKVDLTMAYVGTRKLFEEAGFTKAANTSAVSGGFPRVVMRLELC